MSNINLQNSNWLELVFQDKNKAYGAYQLRQENDKTTLKALVLTSGFVLGACLLASFTTKNDVTSPHTIIEKDNIIRVSNVHIFQPKTETIKPKGEKNTKKNIIPDVSTPKIIEAEPVKVIEKPIVNLVNNPNGNENGDPNKKGIEGNPNGNGLPSVNISNGGGNGEVITRVPEGPVGSEMLTKNVSFPGGIDRFRNFVGENYRIPNDLDANTQIKLMVSFVVEVDGSMTNFKLVNSVDRELEKEAFRVLKSLKTKWNPGELNGQKVRSYFTLPIILQVNSEN